MKTPLVKVFTKPYNTASVWNMPFIKSLKNLRLFSKVNHYQLKLSSMVSSSDFPNYLIYGKPMNLEA